MVGRFDADQKDRIILLLLAFSQRLGERVADTYLEMIEIPADVHRRSFTQDVCGLVSRLEEELFFIFDVWLFPERNRLRSLNHRFPGSPAFLAQRACPLMPAATRYSPPSCTGPS